MSKRAGLGITNDSYYYPRMCATNVTIESLLSDDAYRAALAQWMGHSADSDDVFQNVAEKLLRHPMSVQSKGYLTAVVKNASIDLHRANQRREHNERELSLQMDGLAGPSADRSLQAIRALEAVQEVLDKQAPLNRKIFLLHNVEGLTQPEIARTMGVHLSTVEKRLRKVRTACLKELKAHLD